MREATIEEFNTVLGNARWPAPRRMSTKRTQDVYYSDCGTEVAEKHILYTRGKVTSEQYMINPDYLEKKKKGT